MAAIISVAGSITLVAVPAAWRSWRRARARRARIAKHMRMIGDSLLIVTMRLEAVEEHLDEIEHQLHRRNLGRY